MREILFRAKATPCKVQLMAESTQTGDWLYGNLLHYAKDAQIWAKDENGSTYNCRVDAETVGQFTGLTDTNGNKIFEGDIVEYSYVLDEIPTKERYIVGIGKCDCLDDLSGCGVYVQDKDGNQMLLNADEITLSRIEVVGNVFDNPELLEASND